MKRTLLRHAVGLMASLLPVAAYAGVGDPQTKTNHEWFPGELSSSTFPRLFASEAAIYERTTGRKVDNDEDKVLASWYWRNINYFHSTVGGENLFGKGWGKTGGESVREFWGGLYGYGYSLCFDTHHQWAGEMEKLLGPGRSRAMGVDGHTSFEVWLTGGEYGTGKWVLLDHDISTVVFTRDGKRMVGLTDINKDFSLVKEGDRSRGWLPGGLHPDDPDVYKEIKWAGYSTGYAAVPPMVNLRAGETLRRYADPGLEDGKTYVYWGFNFNKKQGGIEGPARDRTWTTKPEKMFKATKDAAGSTYARYGNAVYTYTPDFKSGAYKEGVADENDSQVTFEWYSPYIIGVRPPEAERVKPWGIVAPGGTGGLVIKGTMTCPVEVSVDQGKTWIKAETKDGMDLTDAVKGYRQYLLRFGAGAKDLADKGLTITTVAQCAQTVVPHVSAGKNLVTYESSGRGYLSAGPTKAQAAAHVVAGAIDGKEVTLKLVAPRQAKTVAVYGAFHASTGSPPKPSKFNIDCSTDDGKTWLPVLKDWEITVREPDPGDYWSQTLDGGDLTLPTPVQGPVLVRFSNTGGRPYLRAEAQLVYDVPNTSPLKVTYAWKEGGAVKTAEHTYEKSEPNKADATWTFDAGEKPQTWYVEYSAK